MRLSIIEEQVSFANGVGEGELELATRFLSDGELRTVIEEVIASSMMRRAYRKALLNGLHLEEEMDITVIRDRDGDEILDIFPFGERCLEKNEAGEHYSSLADFKQTVMEELSSMTELELSSYFLRNFVR